MKKYVLVLSCLLSLVSCSHRIYREGYSVKKSDYWDCDLPIKASIPTDKMYIPLGQIRFEDCKNSKIKTKEQVLSVIKKEGCAIDAEFAIIESDSLAGGENLCYQCKASYYVEQTKSKSNPDYKSPNTYKTLSPSQFALLSVGLGVSITLLFVFLSFN